MELWFVIPSSIVFYTVIGTVVYTLAPDKHKDGNQKWAICEAVVWPLWVPLALCIYALYLTVMKPTYKTTRKLQNSYRQKTSLRKQTPYGSPVPKK
jgi:hypothetical protein